MIARWSLFVTQLNGAYPSVRIDGRMLGEHSTASIRVEPRLYVLKGGTPGFL